MKRYLLFIFLGFIVSACSSQAVPVDSAPPAISPTATQDLLTQEPVPTATLVPTPTATPIPTIEMTATVWENDPSTVILTYHQFASNKAEKSTGLKVRLADFEQQLGMLYDAGFSLVTLEDWMAGKIRVPEGRRPLILSMDDVYFNNQIRLDETGTPRLDTGIGILWAFYQEHPDFGCSAALFANLGDKLYADPDESTWEMELAEAIVWGIEHDIKPYNHFYTHPQLNITSGGNILWEAEQNDRYLRDLLTLAKREDLFPKLGNILALTYGVWPKVQNIPVMLSYQNPEGLPVQAVMEIDPISLEKYLPPPWAESYDLVRMPRHVASPSAIEFLVAQVDQFPQSQTCHLANLPEAAGEDTAVLVSTIADSAKASGCASGVYIVGGDVFRVDVEAGTAEQLTIQTELVYP